MLYEVFENEEQEVEAAQFLNEEGDAAEVVQNLLDSGVRFITVSVVPSFPQEEDSSLMTTITFLQNGVCQTLFEGDYLAFDEADNAIVWNEEDFTDNFNRQG